MDNKIKDKENKDIILIKDINNKKEIVNKELIELKNYLDQINEKREELEKEYNSIKENLFIKTIQISVYNDLLKNKNINGE